METLNHIEMIDLKTKKIAFLGYGKMMQGITRQLFDQEIIDKTKCLAINKSGKSREKNLRFTTNHQEIRDFDIIFVGYKQPDLRAEPVFENMDGKIVISIIAGIPEKELQQKFRGAKIVRAMPNRGSVVGEGCTFLKFSRDFSEEEKEMIENLFKASGTTCRVETTDQIDQGTIFSASMLGVIAFIRDRIHNALQLAQKDEQKSRDFFQQMENIVTDLAKKANFTPNPAKIIHQTFVGAEKLAETGASYTEIQASVTSKNGTTQAMIENLVKNKIDQLLTEIFSGNSLNQEKMKIFADFLDKSCQAGLARAKEMAEEKN